MGDSELGSQDRVPRDPAEAPGRSFLGWFAGGVVAMALFYLASAVVVDPRGVFRTGLLPASVLHSRQLKLSLFRAYTLAGRVDGIIVGSSRAMLISPQVLGEAGCGRFFNFAVDSARTEDYLAIFRWVVAQGATPAWLLIGLDVEALHNAAGYDERLQTTPPLMGVLGEGALGRLRNESASWLHIGRVVMSDGYARGMLTSLGAQAGGRLEKSRFGSDGCLRYLRWEEERRVGRFDLNATIEASCDEYRRRFAAMTGVSSRRIVVLEQLLKEAAARHVKVVLWITPLHPRVVQALERDTAYADLLVRTRDLAAGLEQRFGVRTLDLSEPERFGGNDLDWWDGGHVNEQNAARIAHRLASEMHCNGL